MSGGRPATYVPPLLPLSYLIASYLGMAATFGLIAAWSDGLLVHFQLPNDIAITHAATLGWITTAIMGGMYQFGPNGLHRPLLSPTLGFAHLPVTAAGWPLMVAGFHSGRTEVLLTGATLSALGIATFVANVAPCVWRAGPSPTRTTLLFALAALVATATVGMVFAVNRKLGLFTVTSDRLAVHTTLGIAGWLTLTLMAVGYRMIPIHAVRDPRSARTARIILALVATGVAAVSIGALLASGPLIAVGSCTAGCGALLFVARAARRRARLLRPWDAYEVLVACSSVALAASVLLVALGATGILGTSFAYRWPIAAAILALGGWLGLAVIAQSYRIVPFLVWFLRFSRRSAGAPVPLLTDLYPVRAANIAAAGGIGAVAAASLAALLDREEVLRVGGLIGCAAALLHLAVLAQTLWRTGSTRHGVESSSPITLGAPGSARQRF